MKRLVAALAFASIAALPAWAADPIRIVAAENFYGDIAAAVGGAHVSVSSILNNPDQDPHLFEASPSIARDLAAARIVVLNGADYDPWVTKLLSANAEAGRATIVAANLLGRKPGDNPHLWYDPATMPAVASALALSLDAIDPANKVEYDNNLKRLDASLQQIADKIAAIRARFDGAEVTATEPVFGYMAAALGLKMRNERFQLAVMNDTEPSARDTAAMEADLKGRKVKVFFYNNQVTDPLTERLLKIADAANVPVVGVSETQPAGKSFTAWMLTQLDATEKALAGPSS
jgi:zinc/manganese transport system substrate-binding protein